MPCRVIPPRQGIIFRSPYCYQHIFPLPFRRRDFASGRVSADFSFYGFDDIYASMSCDSKRFDCDVATIIIGILRLMPAEVDD